MATVRDILKALDVITGGRVITDSFGYGGANPFVVTKTSGIPGKAVTELPGLVWGDPDMPVKKVAVMMTLTESAIELAGATGIDCLIAHHPIAEGSNTGGVTARDYFNLYHLAVFELHEAFHGLHPGIAWIHGSCAKHVNIRFGGVPGKIVWYGNALPEVETLGDLLNRIDTIMGTDIESRVLTSERQIRGCTEIHETSIAARAKIFVGTPDKDTSPVAYSIYSAIDTKSVLYLIVYFLMIIGFSYFYATIQFNPVEISNNLKRNGGFIPGFRPGKPTSDFIAKVLNKVTLFGAIYLGIVAICPLIAGKLLGNPSLAIGGTSVIIVVGVALETVRALESQMMMRQYKGFLE